MGELAQAVQATQQRIQAAEQQEQRFKDLLVAQIPAMKQLMPSVMTPRRMTQLAMESFRKNPRLGECTPESIISCLMQCSALGLEPSSVDNMGHAYLIPRKGQCTFLLGYQGMLELMRRTGLYELISVRAVHEGDEFEYRYGTDEGITHIPCAQPGELTHVYLVAYLKGSSRPYFNVLSRAEIDQRRKRSAATGGGPWKTDYEAMAKKTVIRDSYKYLPKSAELQRAFDADGTTPIEYTVSPEVE